jgi:hypothetical protein
MHPTRDTLPVINLNGAGGRVMPGVRRYGLRILNQSWGNIVTAQGKIIIIAGVASFVLLAVIVGVIIYVVSDKDYARQYSAALAEGREFGRRTDQDGCLREGMMRLKGAEEPSTSQLAANDAFIGECLSVSRPTPGFCEGVPSVPYREWVADQCRQLGRADAVCLGVYDAKHTFCNGL